METNGYMSAADLFKPMKRNFKDVCIEGFGKFRLRDLNAAEAAEFGAERFTKTGDVNRSSMITANARIIVLCCVDEEGNPVFSRDDVHRIQELPAGKVAQLAEACLDHVGLTDNEDTAKN